MQYPTQQNLFSKIKNLLIRRELPFRLNWMKKLKLIEMKHWPRIIRSLDYKSLFSSDENTANFNNTIVKNIILEVFGPKMLKAVLEEADRLDIKLFLTHGTLLGHVRENGFIKHDWDIDLGMLEEDIPKMESLKNAVEARGYPVARESRHRMAFKNPTNVFHLDVDYYFKKGDKRLHYVYNQEKSELYTFSYSINIFGDFKKIRFLGNIDALILVESERFLTEIYGDWRTPRQNIGVSNLPNTTITKIGPKDHELYRNF